MAMCVKVLSFVCKARALIVKPLQTNVFSPEVYFFYNNNKKNNPVTPLCRACESTKALSVSMLI